VTLASIGWARKPVLPAPHAPQFRAVAPISLERQPRRDLYGNEVNDAVATYKVNQRGALYEEHSPRTELPRLSSPRG
jgi:hypothetical protein